MLGNLRLARGADPISRLGPPRVEALFSFFLVNRGRLWPRDTVAEVFWGNAGRAEARNSLNTCLSELRRTLARLNTGVTVGARSSLIGLEQDAEIDVDVDDFREAARVAASADGDEADRSAALERADRLYQGDLLEGTDYAWCLVERERLAKMHRRVLELLMARDASAGATTAAIQTAERLLSLDPLREDVHRQLMRLYVDSGRRSEALIHYHRVRLLLREELDVSPMSETEDLYRAIAADDAAPVSEDRQTEPLLHAIEDLERQLRALRSRLDPPAAHGPDPSHVRI
jgi:DNA-binding SARP family transcriptional activator